MDQGSENVYLEQVIQQQEKVDRELKRKAAPASNFGMAQMAAPSPAPGGGSEGGSGNNHGVDYRVTGQLWWRNVVVPPNVYVVHTRRGQKEPVHIGLGISFRFIPRTDAFLVIPAAVQTLLINANCICIERQGILVQAYVQWIIDDIDVAYRKLDFSDRADPMHVVNVQLREQAEAAIKDKVATLSIDEVLSDKQPIIEELTHRLRLVVEGAGEGGDTGGLGLKIVTVQIKEAVVSSTRVWQNLQIPFRAEREKVAKLAQLESERQVSARELENRVRRETEEIDAAQKLAQLRAEQERQEYDLKHEEEMRRRKLLEEGRRESITEQNATAKHNSDAELELALHKAALEKERIAAEIEQEQLKMQLDAAQAKRQRDGVRAELEVAELRDLGEDARRRRELARIKTRRDIDNTLSPAFVQQKLIEKLPEIAEKLPVPQEQRTTIIAGEGEGAASPLLRFIAGAMSLIDKAGPEDQPAESSEEI